MRELKKVAANVANAELYALEGCGHKCPSASSITFNDYSTAQYIMPKEALTNPSYFQNCVDGWGTQSKAMGFTYYHIKVGNSVYCYKIAQDKQGVYRSYLQ